MIDKKGENKHKQEAWRHNKLRCKLKSRPRNRAFGAHHWIHLNVPPLSMSNWNDVKPVKNICENEWWPQSWSFRWPKMTQKLGFWGRYSTHLLSSSNWHVDQDWWETSGFFVRKWPRSEFWGLKCPKNWPLEAHILHTSKSTCNEHVKQCWCETSENFLRKWLKTRILTYFGVQKGPKYWAFEAHILHISESSSVELIKQD